MRRFIALALVLGAVGSACSGGSGKAKPGTTDTETDDAATGTGGGKAGAGGGGSGGGTAGAGGMAGGTAGAAGGGTAGAQGAPDAGRADVATGADSASGDSARPSGDAVGGTMGAVTCGTTPAAFAMSKLGNPEGLVVGPDGTVYFSNFRAFVGRYKAPYATADAMWAKMPDATAQVLGVILDPVRKVVYAGGRVSNKLYRITMTDVPTIDKLADADGDINGVTLGEDGAVYYTAQTTGHVFRVTPDGVKTQVTKTPVAQANGIAFGPDKDMYVLSWTKPGVVTRIKLDAMSKEASREKFAEVPLGNADGIAFDKMGNMYVTSGGLYKITPDKVVSMVDPTGGANVEFGAGSLACTDLLWSTRKMTVPVAGMDVPWHRQP